MAIFHGYVSLPEGIRSDNPKAGGLAQETLAHFELNAPGEVWDAWAATQKNNFRMCRMGTWVKHDDKWDITDITKKNGNFYGLFSSIFQQAMFDDQRV